MSCRNLELGWVYSQLNSFSSLEQGKIQMDLEFTSNLMRLILFFLKRQLKVWRFSPGTISLSFKCRRYSISILLSINIKSELVIMNADQINKDIGLKYQELFDLELKNQFLDEEDAKSNQFENSSATNFYFQKYLLTRNFYTLISFCVIFIGFFAYRLEFDQKNSRDSSLVLYIIVEIQTAILLALKVVEWYLLKKKNEYKVLLKEVYGGVNYVLVIKILVSIVHPNILFFRMKFINEETYNHGDQIMKFQRNFNEYLYLFQLTWLYFNFLGTQLLNTIWASDQSDRVARYVGFRLSDMYYLKCLMRESKKATVLLFLVSTLFYYTIALTVIESPLFYLDFIYNMNKSFIYPSISLWNTMVTLFTIGYGDIYVVTYLGRIFVSVLAILAGIILSFVTVAMTIDFDFGEQDKRAFILVNSVSLRQQVEEEASAVIVQYFKLVMMRMKDDPKIKTFQTKYDLERRSFMEVFNEYKNNRIYDPYYPLFHSMNELENKIEQCEKRYQIVKKP